MRSTSEIPLQTGSMPYGRKLILVWNVTHIDAGYEYDSIEVPKYSTVADILSALESYGIDDDTIQDILMHVEQDATEVINGS